MTARIVHVTTVHAAFDTRIFWKQCRSLARAGYEVALVAPDAPDGERDGVRLCGVPGPSGRLDRVFSTGRAAVRRALALRPDLVHLHDPELLAWVALLRRGGRAVVFDMHENLPAAIISKPWVRPALRTVLSTGWRIAERLLLRHVPVVFAERSYRRAYPFVDEWEVVQNLPDVEALTAIRAEKHATPSLAYIGTLSRGRGCRTMVAAVEALRRRGLDARLELVGGVTDPACRALIDAAAGPDAGRVRAHGRVAPDVGWPIVARCHVGLALLDPTPNYVESYPTKLFEYMALGLPVVVSDFPLYREVVDGERCGICVDPRSMDEVVGALAWLLEHPDEAAEMGRRGRRAVVERYAWAGECERLLSFYDRQLRQRTDARSSTTPRTAPAARARGGTEVTTS